MLSVGFQISNFFTIDCSFIPKPAFTESTAQRRRFCRNRVTMTNFHFAFYGQQGMVTLTRTTTSNTSKTDTMRLGLQRWRYAEKYRQDEASTMLLGTNQT